MSIVEKHHSPETATFEINKPNLMQFGDFSESLSPLYAGLLAMITAVIVSYYAIPVIVTIARKKGLVDAENDRTSHHGSVPSLGGVAIFAGLILGSSLFIQGEDIHGFQYILAPLIIIFFIGQRDDILGLRAWKKLVAQIVASLILILLADIRITTFHGFAGIHDIPFWASLLVSLFLYLIIINAFNLIDGIDGLASGTGIMVSFLLGLWLFGLEKYGMSVVAWSLTGGLIPFFFFNVFGKKNKLFMGDTGSLMVGMLAAVFAITICSHELPEEHFLYMRATPSVMIAVLIFPLFDLLRIFTLRIMKGRSPFSADRNHIHHLFIDSGISHRRSSFYIILLNMAAILIAWLMRNESILTVGLTLLGCSILMVVLVRLRHRRRNGSGAPAQ